MPAIKCIACAGTGRNQYNDPCNTCDGVGLLLPEPALARS